MTGAVSWKPQPFESEFAGVAIGKLEIEPAWKPVSEQISQMQDTWINEEVWMISCRFPVTWTTCRKTLENNGFRSIETLVTFFQTSRPGLTTHVETGPAEQDEIEMCVNLAHRAFTFDRLHRDKKVPNSIADTIRGQWVRNDINERAAAPLVARKDGHVAGFNLCLKRERTAIIDLIAVAPDFQRQGIAAALIEAAFDFFGDTIDGIQVGTQADNLPSMRLYERSGFTEQRREITMHWVNEAITPGMAEPTEVSA